MRPMSGVCAETGLISRVKPRAARVVRVILPPKNCRNNVCPLEPVASATLQVCMQGPRARQWHHAYSVSDFPEQISRHRDRFPLPVTARHHRLVRRRQSPGSRLSAPADPILVDDDFHPSVLWLPHPGPCGNQQLCIAQPLNADGVLRHAITHEFGCNGLSATQR